MSDFRMYNQYFELTQRVSCSSFKLVAERRMTSSSVSQKTILRNFLND